MGGIVCLYKNELKVTKVQPPFEIKTMEFMETLLTFRSRNIRFVTIYRPEPDSDRNPYTMTVFYKEFAKHMSHYNLIKDEVFRSGDFNFHVNKPYCGKANTFKGILSSFNLIQHIPEQTHEQGNTLDLLKTRQTTLHCKHANIPKGYTNLR